MSWVPGNKQKSAEELTAALYRKTFYRHHGPGPYSCFYCDELVTFDECHVHHVDKNRRNNSLTNLVAIHPLCHARLHRLGTEIPESVRRKISETHRRLFDEGRVHPMAGRTPTEEHRSKISQALTGKAKTEEHNRKVGDAHRGKRASDGVRAKQSESARRRWEDPEQREAQRLRVVGTVQSEETRRRKSETAKQTYANKPRVPCPTCGMESLPGPLALHRKAKGH